MTEGGRRERQKGASGNDRGTPAGMTERGRWHGETDRRVCLDADDLWGNSRCFFNHAVLILL